MKLHSALFAFLLAPILSLGQSSAPPKGTLPLATVDGQTLTDDDLAPYVQSQLRPLREQEYQIKKKALDTLITQRLLEAAAKKKGLTADKLRINSNFWGPANSQASDAPLDEKKSRPSGTSETNDPRRSLWKSQAYLCPISTHD